MISELDDEKSRELRCEECIFFNSKGLLGGECRVAPPMKSVLGDWIIYPKVRQDHPQCKKVQLVGSIHNAKKDKFINSYLANGFCRI